MSEILYADDTLIVDERGDLTSKYIEHILRQGNHDGLTFNFNKISMI